MTEHMALCLHVAEKHDISLAKRNKHDITSMYMDMDGFKQVNDIKGHVVGDSLLILLGDEECRTVTTKAKQFLLI